MVTPTESLKETQKEKELSRRVDSLKQLVVDYEEEHKKNLQLLHKFDSTDSVSRLKVIARDKENAILRKALADKLKDLEPSEKRDIILEYYEKHP
jgi:hypothetical protein